MRTADIIAPEAEKVIDERLIEMDYGPYEGRNILISTHAIAMKGALEYLTPDSHGSYWAKNIANCDIYTAEVKDGQFLSPNPV